MNQLLKEKTICWTEIQDSSGFVYFVTKKFCSVLLKSVHTPCQDLAFYSNIFNWDN